jgi:hypothetical protein
MSAEAAAGDLGVDIAGGASTVRQAFAAGMIDELYARRRSRSASACSTECKTPAYSRSR